MSTWTRIDPDDPETWPPNRELVRLAREDMWKGRIGMLLQRKYILKDGRWVYPTHWHPLPRPPQDNE